MVPYFRFIRRRARRVVSTTWRTLALPVALLAFGVAHADSDLDPFWNPPGGYTVTEIGASDAIANALAIDSLGRVILGGYSFPHSGAVAQFTLLRYYGDDGQGVNSPGYPDLGFNSTGVATTDVGIDGANGYAIQIGANDSIAIAGDCTNPAMPQNHAFCLARFTSTGALDTSFGTAGKVITRLGPDDAYPKAMTSDASGNLLVAGYSSNYITGYPVFTVVRYSPSGVADANFGFAGYASAADPAGGTASASAIAIDHNGLIVVAGSVANATYPNGAFAVIRFQANGTPDSTFNGGQIAVSAYGNGGSAGALAIDEQNRPVLAGLALPTGAPSSQLGLVRFTSGGAVDTTFGSAGQSSPLLPGCTEAGANAIALDATGRFFVGGVCRTTQPVLALTHFNADGTLDQAFAPQGLETERFGAYASIAALAIDRHGQPIAVGSRQATYEEFVINRHDYLFSAGFE